MDEFEKCLRDYCESAVIGAGANDIGFFKDGARWSKGWIEANMSKECNNCETGYLTLKQATVFEDNQRLREALEDMCGILQDNNHCKTCVEMAQEALAETEGSE